MFTALLLLSCSARKRLDVGELSAIERYDGPAFRVLRRFLRQLPQVSPEIWIVSARFGLINSQTIVPLYDERLSGVASDEWKNAVKSVLKLSFDGRDWDYIFIDAGASYRQELGEIKNFLPILTRAHWAQGAPGMRAAQLRFWLEQLAPTNVGAAPAVVPYDLTQARSQAKFRGEIVSVEATQLCALAQRWCDLPPAQRYRPFLWSVAIVHPEGVAVLPLKWLVSQLVGVPPGKFSTSQATAFLRDLGLQNAIFSKISENYGD